MSKIRRQFRTDPEGTLWTNLEFPLELWRMCEETAKKWRFKPIDVAQLMLTQFAAHVVENGPKILGPAWADAYQVGVVKERELAQTREIDYNKLHRNERTKSNFEGVYVNGAGFRAVARDPKNNKGQVVIGTFERADVAAWKRYLFYLEHRMPYGLFEEAYELMRTGAPEMDHESLCSIAAQHLHDVGKSGDSIPAEYKKYYGPNALDREMRRERAQAEREARAEKEREANGGEAAIAEKKLAEDGRLREMRESAQKITGQKTASPKRPLGTFDPDNLPDFLRPDENGLIPSPIDYDAWMAAQRPNR